MGWPDGLLIELLFMVMASGLVWVPATLLTAPVDVHTLRQFYARVRPPGWWRPVARGLASPSAHWATAAGQWLLGSLAIIATSMGPLALWLGQPITGWLWCGAAAAGWMGLWALGRVDDPDRHLIQHQQRHGDQ